ncbi:hypothetical protein NHX12_007864 [Muraenolepis orangiensis]|uniref:Uncharacterized protein n=1 Tax=Muraenolepis orangiensis TaxID=630683 RepID=A0A9Q0IA27_9TELE|nr:hypothetical protein NHX12_007864 [Muraenolepis orangiensis]
MIVPPDAIIPPSRVWTTTTTPPDVRCDPPGAVEGGTSPGRNQPGEEPARGGTSPGRNQPGRNQPGRLCPL